MEVFSVNNSEHWDEAAGSFQDSYRRGLNQYDKQLLNFLNENNMVFPGAKVIDIGCGVGKYGAELLRQGCEITLMDIAPKMTEQAEANLEQISDECWEVHTRDFDTVALDDPMFGLGYHLSMSTVSPAIHAFESVKKMTDISNAWCFVSRFSKFSPAARDALMKSAGVTPEPIMERISDDVANMIQCVSRAGYLPMVKDVPYPWEDLRSPEEEIRYILSRYEFPDTDPEFVKARLLRAIPDFLDEDGLFHDAVIAQVAWIYWNKNLPENG